MNRRLVALGLLLVASGCGKRYIVKSGDELPATSLSATVWDERVRQAEVAPATSAPDPDLREYRTKPGDTLMTVAAKHLGWERLWQHLAEWNKIRVKPDAKLPQDTLLIVPLRFRELAAARPVSATRMAVAAPAADDELKALPRPAPRVIMPPARPLDQVFRPGEKLTFTVKWYFVSGGEGVMEVLPAETINGNRLWHFRSTARSTIAFFFKVNDWIESWAEGELLQPVRFVKNINEGKYHKEVVQTYDRKAGKATYVHKSGTEFHATEEGYRDLLASFYAFRAADLPPPGRATTVGVHADKKNHTMTIEVLRRETVKVPAGTYKTVLIRPKLMFEGLFRADSDILIWLTDDAARMPVMVESRVPILGSVNVVLTKVEGR